MFTTRDLYGIAYKCDTNEPDRVWIEAGALWMRRYGLRCKCSRKARRRGCWHTWHEIDCMNSLAAAIDSGEFARICDAAWTDRGYRAACAGIEFNAEGQGVKFCTCPDDASPHDCAWAEFQTIGIHDVELAGRDEFDPWR